MTSVNISTYLTLAGGYRTTGLPYTTSTGVRMLYTNALATFACDEVPGDFVETGVFEGAGSIAMMRIIAARCSTKMHYACDSFAGLPDNTKADHECPHHLGHSMAKHCITGLAGSFSFPRDAFEDSVKRENLTRFLNVVPGWFNETLPPPSLRRISFLRLDGDMYESTIGPLRTLYPLVAAGGVVYIDDYGSFAGCAKAVNEYLLELGIEKPEDVLQPIIELGGSKLGLESVWFQKPLSKPTSIPRLVSAVPCWEHRSQACAKGKESDRQMRLAATVCMKARLRDGFNVDFMKLHGHRPHPDHSCCDPCKQLQ